MCSVPLPLVVVASSSFGVNLWPMAGSLKLVVQPALMPTEMTVMIGSIKAQDDVPWLVNSSSRQMYMRSL